MDGEYGPAPIVMVINRCYIFILVAHLLIDAQGNFLLYKPLPTLISEGALMPQWYE